MSWDNEFCTIKKLFEITCSLLNCDCIFQFKTNINFVPLPQVPQILLLTLREKAKTEPKINNLHFAQRFCPFLWYTWLLALKMVLEISEYVSMWQPSPHAWHTRPPLAPNPKSWTDFFILFLLLLGRRKKMRLKNVWLFKRTWTAAWQWHLSIILWTGIFFT